MGSAWPVKPMPGGTMRLAGLGMELAGAVGGGCLLGYWIDYSYETGPWGLLIGAMVGIVGGLYNLIRKAVLESIRVGEKPSGSSKAQKDDADHEPDGEARP